MYALNCQRNCLETPKAEFGGAVRDKLLGLKPHDRDYVVVGRSFDEVLNIVKSTGAQVVYIDSRFGLVRAKPAGEKRACDYVMARKDGIYLDMRRPVSVEPASLLEDLSRRDFTINAMACVVGDEDNIIDPFEGRRDLQHKVLRCVGSAKQRMSEDALRMIRALRFMVTYDLKPDESLHKCLCDATLIAHVGSLPADRIRSEFQKCLDCDAIRALQTLLSYSELSASVFSRIKLSARIV